MKSFFAAAAVAGLIPMTAAAQPPELNNFELAVQCAAALKLATVGIDGPNAQEAARMGGEFERVARELGASLSRDADQRLGMYENALTTSKAATPELFNATVESCRVQGAYYFPA